MQKKVSKNLFWQEFCTYLGNQKTDFMKNRFLVGTLLVLLFSIGISTVSNAHPRHRRDFWGPHFGVRVMAPAVYVAPPVYYAPAPRVYVRPRCEHHYYRNHDCNRGQRYYSGRY